MFVLFLALFALGVTVLFLFVLICLVVMLVHREISSKFTKAETDDEMDDEEGEEHEASPQLCNRNLEV